MKSEVRVRFLSVLVFLAVLAGSVFGETLTITLKPGEYTIGKDGGGFDFIRMAGFSLTSSPGDPVLPNKTYFIALPPDVLPESCRLEISGTSTKLLPGPYVIKPGGPDAAWTDGGFLYDWGEGKNIVKGKNHTVYAAAAAFPARPLALGLEGQMRKWRFIRVDFFPFQYNPVTGALTLVEEIRAEISYQRTGETPGAHLLNDLVMDGTARDLFLNFDEAKAWYAPRDIGSAGPTYNFVLITSQAIKTNSTKLNAFTSHKSRMGYAVKVVTETDFNGLTGQAPNHKAEKIREWLKTNYAALGIQYVLLIGNPTPFENGEGDIPMKMCWPRNDQSTDRESPTDTFYSDLTGNWDADGDGFFGEYYGDFNVTGGVDFAPEVYVGRIPVYGADYAALDSILQKIISYETEPGSLSWRKSALLPMGFQAASYDGAQLAEQMRDDYLTAGGFGSWRQYQQGSGPGGDNSLYTSEEELRGMTIVRDRWAANDYGIVGWWGHGSATSAVVGYSPYWDGTLFDSTYSAALDNAHPSFTYQCSCTNGYPENNNNLQYAILKNGGISTVSATRVSWFNTGVVYGAFDGSTTNSGLGYEYLKRLAINGYEGGKALSLTKSSKTPESGTRYMNYFDFNLYGDPSVGLLKVFVPAGKDDLLGSWTGQGVFFRNSTSGVWTRLAAEADLIAGGDLDGDAKGDLIGIWPAQGGIWVRSSINGAWTRLSSTARHLAAADMDGDQRQDLLGTWDGQGVFYRNSVGGAWVQLATPATLISGGDLDGDAVDDLVGIWAGQGGVWVKYSSTGTWVQLSTTARDITVGDMNGDGRDDFVGTWDGQGVFYRNSLSGLWVKLATPADQIASGDLNGDGASDLIGVWSGQAGVWVKYSGSGTWVNLGATTRDIATGKMAGGAWGAGIGAPASEDAPGASGRFTDLLIFGPGGRRFSFRPEANLTPEAGYVRGESAPGPGEPGFKWAEQRNLVPRIK